MTTSGPVPVYTVSLASLQETDRSVINEMLRVWLLPPLSDKQRFASQRETHLLVNILNRFDQCLGGVKKCLLVSCFSKSKILNSQSNILYVINIHVD